MVCFSSDNYVCLIRQTKQIFTLRNRNMFYYKNWNVPMYFEFNVNFRSAARSGSLTVIVTFAEWLWSCVCFPHTSLHLHYHCHLLLLFLVAHITNPPTKCRRVCLQTVDGRVRTVQSVSLVFFFSCFVLQILILILFFHLCCFFLSANCFTWSAD